MDLNLNSTHLLISIIILGFTLSLIFSYMKNYTKQIQFLNNKINLSIIFLLIIFSVVIADGIRTIQIPNYQMIPRDLIYQICEFPLEKDGKLTSFCL